jgi:hypothetical protein
MKTSITRRAAARGFTLAELMVAMVGAMFIGVAVFTLAKYSSNFYTRESRVADATMQTLVGFERLRSDISRAGFLGTPNIIKDPRICGNPRDNAWPAWLSRLSSVTIEAVPPGQLSTESSKNGITPRRIVLSGSYSSADQFEVRTIINTDPVRVVLEPNSLSMANLGYPGNKTAATLSRVFQPGRALRLLDDVGKMQFAVIASVTGGNEPFITLASLPPLQFRATSPFGCGVRDLGQGYTVNVVNIIRYDIQDLSGDAQFKAMFKGGGPSYESTRRDLVREELDVNGELIPGTRELVSEYTVDLDFSLLVERDKASRLERITDTGTDSFAGDPKSGALAVTGPQLIRAVQAWLSVRSQEADRDTPLSLETTGASTNLLRISVNPSGGPPYARVRTLQSLINLDNQNNLTWY